MLKLFGCDSKFIFCQQNTKKLLSKFTKMRHRVHSVYQRAQNPHTRQNQSNKQKNNNNNSLIIFQTFLTPTFSHHLFIDCCASSLLLDMGIVVIVTLPSLISKYRPLFLPACTWIEVCTFWHVHVTWCCLSSCLLCLWFDIDNESSFAL